MVAEVLSYLLQLVYTWLGLFAAPFFNESLLWIVIPVYLNWILAEFYSEKLGGVSFAGAITKGVVLIWVGIDWTRKTTDFLNSDVLGLTLFKYFLCFVWVAFGIFMIYQGISRKKLVKFIGKSRNTTYLTLIFTPLLYNVAPLSLEVLLVVVLFFPIYYLVVEILSRITPKPKIGQEEENERIPSEKERKVLQKQMSDEKGKQFKDWT
jgi:hypothetical protein